MTYVSRGVKRYAKRSAMRRPVALHGPRLGMGSIVSDVQDWVDAQTGNSQTQQCLAIANQQAQPLDAKIEDIAKNWNPDTETFQTSDIRTLIGAIMPLVRQAQAALDQAASEGTSSMDSLNQAKALLFSQGASAVDILAACDQADQQQLAGVTVTNIKQWVISTMQAASSGIVAAGVVNCLRPWWLSAIAVYQSAFDKAWSVVKRIASIVLEAGEAALEIAAKVPGLALDLFGFVKWAAILGGVYWLYLSFEKYKKTGKFL